MHAGDGSARRIRDRGSPALQGRAGIADDRDRLAVESRRAYAWLRQTVEQIAHGPDAPEDFLEHTKLELFQDQVFCFTPKGRLIALPRGATPIDFAYAVHTDVGDTCYRRQGQRPALATRASRSKNGDEVDIVRSAVQPAPPSAWEAIVVTGKARSAIRRVSRSQARRQYAALGPAHAGAPLNSRQAGIAVQRGGAAHRTTTSRG